MIGGADALSERDDRTRASVLAPGGQWREQAKRFAMRWLWTRVTLQRRIESALARSPRGGRRTERRIPQSVPPTAVLGQTAQWRRATAEARRLRLPLHPDRPKNWDALGALAAVLSCAGSGGDHQLRVLDAGSARYSPLLAWLRLYGFGATPGDLVGINLEFDEPTRYDGVEFRHGDVTNTDFPDGWFDAVACLSVIEHGVPIDRFLSEAARILRPGGVLAISTDYDYDPPDTNGLEAYGTPVHIFSADELQSLVVAARDRGLDLVGSPDTVAWSNPERPVHWKRMGLEFTFALLTFRKRP